MLAKAEGLVELQVGTAQLSLKHPLPQRAPCVPRILGHRLVRLPQKSPDKAGSMAARHEQLRTESRPSTFQLAATAAGQPAGGHWPAAALHFLALCAATAATRREAKDAVLGHRPSSNLSQSQTLVSNRAPKSISEEETKKKEKSGDPQLFPAGTAPFSSTYLGLDLPDLTGSARRQARRTGACSRG